MYFKCFLYWSRTTDRIWMTYIRGIGFITLVVYHLTVISMQKKILKIYPLDWSSLPLIRGSFDSAGKYSYLQKRVICAMVGMWDMWLMWYLNMMFSWVVLRYKAASYECYDIFFRYDFIFRGLNISDKKRKLL